MSPLNLPILATAALVTLAISSASAQPCADILKLKSSGSDREAVLTVKNNTGSEMAFDWINFDGQRENYGRVGPNETTKIQTFVGHVWVFADETNACVEGFVATDSNSSFTLTRAATAKTKPENPAREAYVPTKSFAKRDINGFTFLIHPDLTSDQALFAEMVAEFTKQTQNILQVLPAEKSQILKSVSIWVDRDEDPDDVAIFYNSRRWLVR